MRDTYLNTLYKLASKDKNVVSMVSDNGLIVYDDFRRDFPERYFNFGISEGNMVAAAAGMANCGKIPFIYTISAFLSYRAYEFIRDDVCFQNQNVKIVGIGTGMTYSTLGPTHHTTEDIGLLRGLPNLTVFSPATRKELLWMMQETYEIDGPVYIRLGNNKEEHYLNEPVFEKGKPSVVRDGDDIAIFTTGTILNEVMEVYERLEQGGIKARVISVHTLKPLDASAVADLINGIKNVVTVEEHNVISGLYSAIAEALVEEQIAIPVLKIGLEDVFAKEYGELGNVRQANQLDSGMIYEKIRNFYKGSEKGVCNGR